MGPPGRLIKAERMALLAPAAAAAVFLVVLAANLRRLVRGAFWNSDVASLPLIAGDMAQRAGGVARVSVANYYSTFLFDVATRWLPFHRQVWEVFSLAASLAAVVLIAWAAWRACGPLVGILTFAIAVCASPIAFYNAYELRGPTWLTGALLLAFLVTVATATALPPRILWALTVTVGILVGVNLGSDPLLLVSGIAPSLGAAAAARLFLPGPSSTRVLKAALAATVVAGATAVATGRFMRVLGFRIVPTTPIKLAALSQVPHNFALLAHDILAFGNEEFPGAPSGVVSVAGIVTVALCLAALVAIVRTLVNLGRERDTTRTGLALYVLFWALTGAGVGAAFIFTNLPIGDVTSARYLVPVFFGLAAGAGMWASEPRWPRFAVAAVATVFCVLSTMGIGQLVTYFRGYPLAAQGPQLIAFLQAKGLRRGYASYWDSLGLTWDTGSKIGVYPVVECGSPTARTLCRFSYNSITTWYRPHSGSPTFVAVGLPMLPLELSDPPPPGLGSPVEVDHVGIFTVYIYGDDVAARFG